MRSHNIIISIFVAITLPTISGCSSYKPIPTITDDHDGDLLIGETAAISTTYIKKSNNKHLICKMPPPDASFSQSSNFGMDLSFVKWGSDNAGDSTSNSENENELAGRTPAVLMAREYFYRACEISNNFDLTKQEALNLYRETMKMVSTNWAVEAQSTKVTIGDTVTSASGAELYNPTIAVESKTSSDNSSSDNSSTDSSY